MLERVLRPALFLGVLIPMFLVTKFISDYMLAGQPKSEAVLMSLGLLTPVSWVFLLGLYVLEARKNKQFSKRH